MLFPLLPDAQFPIRFFLLYSPSLSSVFFFPAEDGIRDLTVTGVQSCALPILELSGIVSEIAIDAASKIIGQQLDVESRGHIVDEYIGQLSLDSVD